MSNILVSRFENSPVMVAPGRESWMASCLTTLQAKLNTISPDQMKEFSKSDDPDWWGKQGSFKSMVRPYRVENGVLTVPVKGMLLHDFPFAAFGMATGYEYIIRAFERGMEDPEVDSIAMVVDSGGGEVAGCFDATDKLYEMRGTKPMVALLNEHAYSAAYSLASAMDQVMIPRSGGAGSVGVVTAHIDRSEEMEQRGLKITFIHAGSHKVDGNPYEPLPESVQRRIQARIDGLYTIFVGTVARNRGMAEQAVRDTEALTYSADEAVAVGFADRVQAFDEAMAALGGSQETAGEIIMSQQTTTEAKTFAQADLDKAHAEGQKAGALAERERIQGILGSEEAKGRQELAGHLAMSTSMNVEDAVATLKATPVAQVVAKEEPPKKEEKGSHFEAAMKDGNPNLGGEGGESAQDTDLSATILADFHNATGKVNGKTPDPAGKH